MTAELPAKDEKEILDKSQGLKRFALFFGHWIPELIPSALAFTTFVSGCILLFSGATPSVGSRLAWLKDFLPLSVLEISHFLGSLAGIGLIFLARGLQRRLDTAYIFTAFLLAAGSVFSILKGIDYEEAIALSIMLAALLPARKYFYRKASLFSEPFTIGWFAAVLAVLACTAWLGFFSFKHVGYSDELWWQFAFSGDAPRFLRALVGVAGTVFTFALAKVFFATRTRLRLPTMSDLEKAFTIVRQSKEAYANLALLGDKEFLFSEHENAFLMYAVQGRSWIVFGDPVGPEKEALELMWRFRELCDLYDGWPVFYNVKRDYLSYYLDLGLNVIKTGEEARIPLDNFTMAGGAHSGLRHAHNRIEKEGCSFRLIEHRDVPSVLPALKVISNAWLRKKNTKEKRFSLGFFDFRYLAHFPIAIVEKENKPIAFANVLLSADQNEISIDLMRYLPEAPQAVMEYFLIELILLGKKLGYHRFNLGVVPLSGLQDRVLASGWSRFGAFLFQFGEHFYNFQGLRQFKEKFDPVWEPKYLVSPGGIVLPRILTDLATLISGGFKGLVSKDS